MRKGVRPPLTAQMPQEQFRSENLLDVRRKTPSESRIDDDTEPNEIRYLEASTVSNLKKDHQG